MKHKSVALPKVEFIDLQESDYSPLISKCSIKVCYVSDEPNRNRSVITKEVATSMAPSVRGAMIVGHYVKEKEDFEEHNRIIKIHDGKVDMIEDTQPYGFVAPNAKVWFQDFEDDDKVIRTYLMTEGFLWTDAYPECKRVVERGNNQSMELDEKTLKGDWAESDKYNFDFFIINEAIVSKLCILGEDVEPCFEGSQITSINYSFNEKIYSMLSELKELIEGGTKKVFTRFNVSIGDALWTALYSNIETNYPDAENAGKSIYSIREICVGETENQQIAILAKDEEFYSMSITLNEDNTYSFGELTNITEDYKVEDGVENQFSAEDIDNYISEYVKNKDKNSDKTGEEDTSKNEGETEEKKCPECGKPLDECTCEKEKEKKKEYSLDEIPEYTELLDSFNELSAKYNALVEEKESLSTQLTSLVEFKANIDKKEKEAMIEKFYMLSDEDKKDVIANIDTYSVDDIEAKLSIICVRNKVSFDLEDDNNNDGNITYNLNESKEEDDSDMPAWVKAALNVAKNKN